MNEDKKMRRHRLDLNKPAEKAIYDAIQEVEKLGADVRLTHCVTILSMVKDLVSDYIDSQSETLDDSQPDNPPKDPPPSGN